MAQGATDGSQARFAAGVQLLRDGHPAEAKEQLDLAVKAAPHSADMLTWRGICENQLEQYAVAAKDFEAALRIDGAMLPAHYNYALTLIRLHKTSDAIAQLRLVLAAQPGAVQALYNLAILLESQGSFAEAAEHLRLARAAAPEDQGVALHLLLDDIKLSNDSELPALVSKLANGSTSAASVRGAGTALLEVKRFSDAVTLLTAAENREPNTPGVRLLLARALIGDRQDGAAITLLNSFTPAPAEASEHAYLLGLAYLDQGATSEAADAFEAACKLDPNDARPLYHLALLAAQAPEKRAQAARLFRASIALEPKNADYALALARLLLIQDKPAEAADVLARIKDAGADEAQKHALLGVALASNHGVTQAVPELQKALEQDPTLALADNVLGFCLLQQGEYLGAAEVYGRASELDPKRALYAHDAALAFERANRPDQALRFAERAVKLDDTSAVDHVLLGKLYAGAGRNPEALVELLRATALNPESDAACYLLARTYRQQGDREQALAWSNKLSALKQKQDAAFAEEKQSAAQTIRSSRLLEGGSYSEPAPETH